MDTTMELLEQCDFCNEFRGNQNNAFAALYKSRPARRIAFETPSFVVMPSLGQIVLGYLLVVPKVHFVAIADMPHHTLVELEELRAKLLARLSAHYGAFLFFEHGTRTKNCGGCGITHAHLHAVPFPATADPIRRLKDQWTYHSIRQFLDLKDIPMGSSYLYYESVTNDRFAFYPEAISSQYVRRLLADALNSQDWDWRVAGRENRLVSTLSETTTLLGRSFPPCSHSTLP